MHNKELKIREAKNDNLLNKELKNTIMNSSQSKKKAYTGPELEELLKIPGVEDVEYEFFLNGKTYNLNQTIFEILKQTSEQKNKYGFSTAPDVA